MIKKANVAQLRVGMFVHDFNCGWLENPFFATQILLKSGREIEKIVSAGIHDLYIDTDKGLDIADAQTEEEVKKEIRSDIAKIEVKQKTVVTVPMKEELHEAKKLKTEAKKIVTNIMHDVRMGKQVELEAVDNAVENMIESIFRNQGALTSLSRLKSKDEYTFMHSVNVCVLMISFCKSNDIDRNTIRKIGSGGLLHDIGKMSVLQEVLNKPGKLTEEEFTQMKNHVVQSKVILSQTPGISPEAIEVASQHHERYDGSGYPDKLKGEEISRFGQMASIVDVYDAITSDRVYHKGLDSSDALKKIFEWSKYHFHPDLVQLFIKTVGIYPVGTLVRLESGLLGVIAEPGRESMLKPVVRAIYNLKHARFMTPKDIDLAAPGTVDRILGSEDPAKWQIEPLKFIDIL
jgi:HD-GYP domain-containing protein (c-di-GMP phosphodiesterase class II)